MKYTLYILLAFVLFLAACSSSKNMSAKTISTPPVVPEKKITPVVAVESNAAKGKKLFLADCTGCHAYKNPGNYTVAQWGSILDNMFVKANIYDTKQRELIRSFVASEARLQK